MYERWGSLSVKDHLDLRALAMDVLLYDRLVVPVPADISPRGREFEWGRKAVEEWQDENWDPGLLRNVLVELGDLAVTKPWTGWRRETYTQKIAEIRAIQEDIQDIQKELKEAAPYHATRRILAEEPIQTLPEGVTKVNVACAYRSEHDLRLDWFLGPQPAAGAPKGVIFGYQLHAPDGDNPENVLADAVRLARDSDSFKEKRRALYDWERRKIGEDYAPEEALAEMRQLVGAYNEAVAAAVNKVYLKAAFTILAVGLGLLAAPLTPLALAPAGLALVEFATLDRKPVVEAGEAAPAAMFHELESRLGVRLVG